jgi:hypothetical protein
MASVCGTQNLNTAETKQLLKLHHRKILQEMNFQELAIEDVK